LTKEGSMLFCFMGFGGPHVALEPGYLALQGDRTERQAGKSLLSNKQTAICLVHGWKEGSML
jgi:hypothetical protein